MGHRSFKWKSEFAASAIAFFMTTTSAFALDPTQVDVAGIKLYMTKDQAIDAIKHHFGANAKLEISTAAREHGPGKMVQNITIGDGVFTLVVAFAERSPSHGAQEVVYKVGMFDDASRGANPLDEQQLYDLVTKKYGNPVWGNRNDMVWCKAPKNDACEHRAPTLTYSDGTRGAFDGGINLFDLSLLSEADKYEQTQAHDTPHI